MEEQTPGRVQTTASSQVGAESEGQDISSSKAPTGPEKRGDTEVSQDNERHAFYLCKLVQNMGVNILGGE